MKQTMARMKSSAIVRELSCPSTESVNSSTITPQTQSAQSTASVIARFTSVARCDS